MKNVTLALFLIISCHHVSSQTELTTIREYQKTFTTYDFSDPNPIANAGPIYPYFRFDGYTNSAVDKKWTVVELENAYLRIMILPEIGGKIWGAWEKATGKPFLYYNQVVKFRDVAMRGPWTSGGIEANYGIIGHTPNCATPVDYQVRKNDDGSVSCFIGTLDLLTETYWTIEINLPADKAYFTTRSFWSNTTPLEQSYYTWMNAGIKASGNLQFIYPGNKYIGHGGEVADWNVHPENGKDISFYEQNNFGGYKSYHVFGKYTDFFGAYWHDDNYGMGRFSLHGEKAGKKIWIWGLSQQGMIWDRLLTDTDGQYVEVQSGRLFNQAAQESTYTPFKHLGFAPGTTDTWTEFWFPVMDSKGFVKANPWGALNVRAADGLLKIDFSALQKLDDELKIWSGDQLIYTKKISCQPLAVFSDSLSFSGDANSLTVILGDQRMQYNADPQADVLSRPVVSPPGLDWHSLQGKYLLAKESIRQRRYEAADEELRSCLALDPYYLPALSDMSMLMFRNLEYSQSLDYATQALRIDTYDPAGNYYYGLANLALGNITDAKDGFDIASLSSSYRGPAYAQLGKFYFQQKDLQQAIHYALKSLDANAQNPDALQLLALTYRITRDKERARQTLQALNVLNPLNHFIRFEHYLQEPSPTSKDLFISGFKNELPHESFLQLADWYFSIDRPLESLEVLSLAPPNPEVYYWMAFLKNKLGDPEEASYLQKANAMSPAFVFPFRGTSALVFDWVMKQTNDWKPKYYRGLIHWSRGHEDRARELFQQCGDPEYAPFYAARAALANDGGEAADFRRAAELNPTEWRYGKLRIEHAIKTDHAQDALTLAQQYHKRLPQDFRISMLLAKALLLNKQFKACSDLLGQTTILPYEGATDGRQLYREAWLMQAVQQIQRKKYTAAMKMILTARRWPANLGVGKPYDEDIDARLENYLEGICLENTNNTIKASDQWTAVVSYHGSRRNAGTLVTALALRKLNRQDEGEKLLADWNREELENKLAQWCLATFREKASDQPVNAEDEQVRILDALLH